MVQAPALFPGPVATEDRMMLSLPSLRGLPGFLQTQAEAVPQQAASHHPDLMAPDLKAPTHSWEGSTGVSISLPQAASSWGSPI